MSRGSRDRGPRGIDKVVLRFHAGAHDEALFGRRIDHARQHPARRLVHGRTVHHQIACHPRDLRLPRELDEARRIGDREHVGMGRRHVEPRRESRESRPILLHRSRRRGRDQLGALCASQIGEVEQEVLHTILLRECFELAGHRDPPYGFKLTIRPCCEPPPREPCGSASFRLPRRARGPPASTPQSAGRCDGLLPLTSSASTAP